MRLLTVLLVGALIAVVVPAAASAKRPVLRATVTILPGSTLTASVPERPGVRPAGPEHAPRSWPITGALDAKAAPALRSRYFDWVDVPFRGSLAATSMTPDPLCPAAAAPPSRIDVVSPSKLSVSTNGKVSWNLVIRGGPAQLFGCGPAALAGTTTLSVSGRTEIGTLTPQTMTSGITTLKRVPLRGQLSDIALPDGAAGQLTASLIVRVNLRHRR